MVKRLRHRPFTAVTRVRFPLESLYTKNVVYSFADVAQFNEIDLSIEGRALITNQQFEKTSFADVAQLAEQLICNQQVIGSSPIIGFVPKRDRDYMDL